MVVGLLVMAVGAVLFVPAANVPSFGLFLAALIVLAAGVTASSKWLPILTSPGPCVQLPAVSTYPGIQFARNHDCPVRGSFSFWAPLRRELGQLPARHCWHVDSESLFREVPYIGCSGAHRPGARHRHVQLPKSRLPGIPPYGRRRYGGQGLVEAAAAGVGRHGNFSLCRR